MATPPPPYFQQVPLAWRPGSPSGFLGRWESLCGQETGTPRSEPPAAAPQPGVRFPGESGGPQRGLVKAEATFLCAEGWWETVEKKQPVFLA